MTDGFVVERVAFDEARVELHAVRGTVFIDEQRVPAEIERDALDPQCVHVLARAADGTPIGAGRLTPDRRIGRMAVLRDWRGRGVGEAMLAALVDSASAMGWPEVRLHAQVGALAFYRRLGFLPLGPRFEEAGIEHQTMARALVGAGVVETREQGLAALESIAAGTRRLLRVYSRALDPGLLDQPEAVAALRRLGTRGGEVRVLLQDAAAPRRALAPLISLSQRLPSSFAFRVVGDPVDLAYPSAYTVNDADGWYFRPLGHRLDGETRIDSGAQARELRHAFDPVWERSRPATELRALGI
ncbi:GNAT family N-acetyltransferase [Cognatilysobacter bugurensis]|uniref:GNAT family acetyltransferase n=1 Tax=Cognatilysobacter bugurensis TaxID=543356 RepID=A0A918W4F2_9GAMM|nr:GNAT family N-acetyltransferase [Lysobacter bugurensis]GHA71576.1 GNAT family acetyltransferase [Lysobacter bugurensis]